MFFHRSAIEALSRGPILALNLTGADTADRVSIFSPATNSSQEGLSANSLQASGVSNAPEALVNWMSSKFVTGDWSQTYTTEQISLFADPYAQGKRDESLENYLSSTALTGVDRTTEREREVTELYNRWLGPTLGNLTDNERAEIAGKLRDDPDY